MSSRRDENAATVAEGDRTRSSSHEFVAPDETLDGAPVQDAGAAASGAAQPFVGRSDALRELNAALSRALQAEGSLLLVAGEPGIGKTQLAHELCSRARHAGFTTLWSSCWEGGGAPALWPFTQLARAYARAYATAARPADARADLLPLIAQLVEPSARGHADERSAPAEARFRVFDAVSSWLRQLAELRPVLLVIDDLHWADEASLELLRFVANELRDMRGVLLCTYREEELAGDGPCRRMLAGLAGRAGYISLSGLSRAEVAELVASTSALPADASLAAALHDKTAGNPFFVRELVRFWGTGERATAAVPESVRQVIGRRLERLPMDCRELLGACAVLGLDFSLEVLAAVAQRGRIELSALLAPALSARLLETATAPERWRFEHALVREVVYAQLDESARRELHRRAGSAIEARSQPDGDAWQGEVALHFERAGGPADLRHALEYCTRAAQSSRSLSAHGDAAAHLRHALLLLPSVDASDQVRRCELLLELGAAQRAQGSLLEARNTHEQAAGVARALGDAERLGRAALGFGEEFVAGGVDPRETGLLRDALSALPLADGPLRARLLARLGRALLFGFEHQLRAELAETATAMARRLADPASLAHVLYDRHQTLWTCEPEQACRVATEIVQLAEAVRETHLALSARALRLGDLLELGDIDRYRSEAASYARLVAEHKQLAYAWHVPMQEATLAMLGGRFAEAERLGAHGLALGKRIEHQGIEVFHFSVFMTIRYLEGRHRELLDSLRHGVEQYPTLPVFRAGFALALCEAGQRAEAQAELERLAQLDFEDVPRDFLWVFNLALLGLTAHYVGDARRAAPLYAWLLPHAPYNVRVGRIGVSTIGSTQHYLGLLALTLQRWDDAVQHLEAALAAHTRQGLLPMLANSHLQLARALCARAAPGDAKRAADSTRQANSLAAALGIRLLFAERAEPQQGETGAQRAGAAPSSIANVTVTLQLEGEYWTLARGANTLRLRNSVGMRMLARLLAEPASEFAALALRDERGADSWHGDAGELLDARAQTAYRERYAELGRQLEEAERQHDLARRERLGAERAALSQQLSAAIGLGGRRRRAGSGLERARMSVTKALRAAIAKIAEQDHELGLHLELSVQTGHVCCYRPDPASAIRFST